MMKKHRTYQGKTINSFSRDMEKKYAGRSGCLRHGGNIELVTGIDNKACGKGKPGFFQIRRDDP
jgi:hypothetical protein